MAKSYSEGSGCLGSILVVIAYIALFFWYAQTAVPHTHPTVYTNFFWGLVQGIFILPTFIWSLFAHGVTIYQSPNDGNWYNFGFMLGTGALFGGAMRSR